MRAVACSIFVLLTPVAVDALAQSTAPGFRAPSENLPLAKSPAEQKIESARRAIETRPDSPDAHAALALALSRRARETSDPDYYVQAAVELQKSLELEPDNFGARKVEAWIALGQHEFARALELTRALRERAPDDVFVYALLTDACIETGNYEEAEKAAQWALDLRPGEIPALTRAAYLRELFGDWEGAIQLMQSAYEKTAPAETEDRAWHLTQLAHLYFLNGKFDVAEANVNEALRLFPDYHYALAQLVRLRSAQKRLPDAVDAARKFCQAAPHPENLFVLGKTLARAGRSGEARKVFADFEKRALAESDRADNANHELVFYYANHAGKPKEALRIAQLEISRRQDVFTLDAYAWALHLNGRSSEAGEAIKKALAIGIRDPAIFYHAGTIAAKSGDQEDARRYLQASLGDGPNSEVSELARRALAGPKKKRK